MKSTNYIPTGANCAKTMKDNHYLGRASKNRRHPVTTMEDAWQNPAARSLSGKENTVH